MNMKQLCGTSKTLLAGTLSLTASIALGGCGTTNYYVVLPEQMTDSATIKPSTDSDKSKSVSIGSQAATLQEIDCGRLKQTFVMCKSIFENAANAEDQGIQAFQIFETKYANELEFCNKVVEINWIIATPHCFPNGI